jgi:hypothetical protein
MGSGFKNFTGASILTASDVNNYFMEQSVMSFASTGARDSQIAAPETGMVAYVGSADVNEGLYHRTSASTWRKGPGWNAPWGFQAFTSTQSNTVSSTYITGLDTTFTAIANRRYKITLHLSLNTSVGRALFNITDGATVLRRVADQTNPVYEHLEASHVTTLTAGSHTIRATLNLISGSFSLLADASTNTHSLLIEDIGPSGAPV